MDAVSMSAVFYVASTTPFGMSSSVTSNTTLFIPQWDGLKNAPNDVVCFVGKASDLEPDIRSVYGGWGWGWSGDCAVENGCGARIHTGDDCTDTASQGGNWYNAESISFDPWSPIGYRETDSNGYGKYAGCVRTGFDDLTSSPDQLIGHPFIIYGTDGERVSCGLISGAPGNFVGPTALETDIQPIPGLIDSISSSSEDETSDSSSDESLNDGLDGSGESSSDEQLSDASSSDESLNNEAGSNDSDNDSGSGSEDSSSEDSDSSYQLSPNAAGFVSVLTNVQELVADGVCYMGYATGLLPNVESFLLGTGSQECDTKNGCGTHIHEGPSCENKASQGSHYYNDAELAEDPWQAQAFLTTDSAGETPMFGCVINGDGATHFGSRAFIVHDHLGDRVLCGLLPGKLPDDFSSENNSSSEEEDKSSSDEDEDESESDLSSDEEESSSDEVEGAENIDEEEVSSSDEYEGSCRSITEIACSSSYDEQFSVMCYLLERFDLNEIVSSGAVTAFFPTNQAFENIGIGSHKAYVDALDDDEASDILLFHIVKDNVVMINDLLCKGKLRMANSKESRTKCEVGLFQKGAGNAQVGTLPEIIVTDSDIPACNGIVHTISEVMIPP
jgi:uncharacterized surface protein with fasciclin (FAS1) repeats